MRSTRDIYMEQLLSTLTDADLAEIDRRHAEDAGTCIFQPGDKVAWEYTPPLARWSVVCEMSGRFIEVQGDKALIAVSGPDGELYRKIDVNRLYIKLR